MRYPKNRAKACYGDMTCSECGVSCERVSAVQKYCRKCSTVRDLDRKKKWAVEKGRVKFNAEREAWRDKGKALSRAETLTLDAWAPPEREYAWSVRLAMPFAWSASKNHIFSNTRNGHTFLRDEARYFRAELAQRVFAAVSGVKVRTNKLWLDMYVQKPNHRGDAANFLDLVCDAVKDAIPLDDRWYSVGEIDWEIRKVDPMIFIRIGQVDDRDVQACSSCGRLLTYPNFQSNKNAKNGVTRVCRECQAVTRNSKKSRASHLKAVIQHGEGVFG